MDYNNNNNQEKPLPSVEYSMKNISWHLKTISENLARLTEHLTGQKTPTYGRGQQTQNYSKQNFDQGNMPF
jgi:hypothetical protein